MLKPMLVTTIHIFMRGLLTNDIMAPALTPTLTIFFHDFAATKQLQMFVPGHKP